MAKDDTYTEWRKMVKNLTPEQAEEAMKDLQSVMEKGKREALSHHAQEAERLRLELGLSIREVKDLAGIKSRRR